MKYACLAHPGHVYDDDIARWTSVCPFCFTEGQPRTEALRKTKKAFVDYSFTRGDYESPTKDGSGGKVPRRQGSE